MMFTTPTAALSVANFTPAPKIFWASFSPIFSISDLVRAFHSPRLHHCAMRAYPSVFEDASMRNEKKIVRTIRMVASPLVMLSDLKELISPTVVPFQISVNQELTRSEWEFDPENEEY